MMGEGKTVDDYELAWVEARPGLFHLHIEGEPIAGVKKVGPTRWWWFIIPRAPRVRHISSVEGFAATFEQARAVAEEAARGGER